jgi:hypothetical protein
MDKQLKQDRTPDISFKNGAKRLTQQDIDDYKKETQEHLQNLMDSGAEKSTMKSYQGIREKMTNKAQEELYILGTKSKNVRSYKYTDSDEEVFDFRAGKRPTGIFGNAELSDNKIINRNGQNITKIVELHHSPIDVSQKRIYDEFGNNITAGVSIIQTKTTEQRKNEEDQAAKRRLEENIGWENMGDTKRSHNEWENMGT